MSRSPLFSGKSTLRQVTDDEIINWVSLNMTLMEDIMSGKVHSWRHQDFVQGPPNKRLALKYHSLGILKGDQLYTLSMKLSEAFAKGSTRTFNYVNSVLVPEAVVWMVMEFYKIAYNEAEKISTMPYEDTVDLESAETVGEVKGQVEGMSSDMSQVIQGGTSVSLTRKHKPKTSLSEVLTRGKIMQKRQKRRSMIRDNDDEYTLTFYPMVEKNLGFRKHGLPVELIVSRKASYKSIIDQVGQQMKMKPSSGSTLALFKPSGVLITSSDIGGEPWTMESYIRAQHKSADNIKLGVGVIKKERVYHSLEHGCSSGYGSLKTEKTNKDPVVEVSDSEEDGEIETEPEKVNTEEITDHSDEDFEKPKKVKKKKPKQNIQRQTHIPSCRVTRQPAISLCVPSGCMLFSPEELCEATLDYNRKCIIGKGGFGVVYKGMVRGSLSVAVKVLNQAGTDAILRAKPKAQMETEIAALTRFRHPNIVPLCGYCPKPPSLVYEFMENGSLFSLLHESKDHHLSWVRRRAILHDSLKGLVYLHKAEPPLIHQDIKSANVLVDYSWTGRIADFGFCSEIPHVCHGYTMFKSNIDVRSEGYYPPEITSGKVSDRSDVYSYGIVVLETFTGQLVFDKSRPDQKIIDHLQDDIGDLPSFKLTADKLIDEPDEELTRIFFDIFKSCTKSHSKRPSSCDVLPMWYTV